MWRATRSAAAKSALSTLWIDNPVSGIVRPKDGTDEWRMDDTGYRQLGKCLAAAESSGHHWQRVLASRAAALTGCRLDEIEGLLKAEVDESGMALRLGWLADFYMLAAQAFEAAVLGAVLVFDPLYGQRRHAASRAPRPCRTVFQRRSFVGCHWRHLLV
jgi:hypothetical protein